MTGPRLLLGLFGVAALAATATSARASTTVSSPSGICYAAKTADRLITASDKALLIWEQDGDLALYGANSSTAPIWTTSTAGANRELCIGSDGDMWIDNYETGAVLWSRYSAYTGTNATIEIDDGCDLQAKAGSTAYWTVSGTCPGESQASAFTGWCADTTSEVTLAQSDWAKLSWTTGGKLVMYATGADDGDTIWTASSTAGAKLCFEDGGRLAIYSSSSSLVWQSGSAGDTSREYQLGLDDCALQINRFDTGASVYTTSTSCPQPTEANNWTLTKNSSADQVIVENDSAELVFTSSGALQLRAKDGDIYWKGAYSGTTLSFQSDGNFVLYSGSTAVWSSGTANKGVNQLSLDGCSFKLTSTSTSTTYYTRGSSSCSQASIALDGSSVSRSGASIFLRSGDAYLTWTANGYLKLVTTAGTTLWAANSTAGTNVNFQTDGNLTVHDSSGSSVYYANSVATTATKLVLDSCKLTLQDGSGNVIKTLNADCNVASYSYESTEGNSTFGVVLSHSLTATAGSPNKVTTTNGIDLSVFGNDVSLFSATGYQTSTDDGSSLTLGAVEVLGTSMSLSFSVSKEFFSKEKTFVVGVVPVTVGASASGSLGLSTEVSLGTMTITPSAGLYAEVSAGIGGGSDYAGTSAGIKGQLTLLELSLPIKMKIYYSSGWKFTVSGELTIETLSGTLSLYAEAFVKLFGIKYGVEYSYKLFSWTGLQWTKTLFSKTSSF